MVENWEWLAGTYWYVPPAYLSAPMFQTGGGEPSWLVDQTVWQILGYRNGYFWGNVALSMQPAAAVAAGSATATPTGQKLTASVTPEGNVYMTFMSEGSSSDSAALPIGLGNMRWRDGAWAAEMQMATSPSSTTRILHWAYMLQCVPGDPAWEKLPGTDMSVPAFLEAAGFTVNT